MAKSRIFLVLALSFIGGVSWRSFSEKDYLLLFYILLLTAIILLAVFYKNKIIMVVSFGIIFFVLGAWLTQIKLDKAGQTNLDGKEIAENIIVVKEPDPKDNYQNVVVKTNSGQKILLTANLAKQINYGDELNLKCTLKIPDNKNAGFDYQMYLAKDGIYYLCQSAQIEKTGVNRGNKIYAFILNLKNKLKVVINSTIPQPEAALGNGLIFGGSSDLSKNVSADFSKTGTTHIIAVSGYNVTIIANCLMYVGIFIGLWRKKAFWFAVVGVFLFVAMVGFPSSAVRAGVMGTLLLWAMKNGRLANSTNAIVFAAAVMLLINPLLLRWDIGFQLSFLATMGIVTLSPFWEKIKFRKRWINNLLEIIFLTLSAQIFVLPILLLNFNILSAVSILANALILPIVPLGMFLVFLTGAVGLVSTELATPLAWVTFLPLKWMISAVNFLASLKWSSFEIKNFNVILFWSWYGLLFLAVLYFRKTILSSKKDVIIKEK